MVLSYLSVCAFTLIGLHAFAVYLLPDLLPASWHFLKRTWGFHFLTFYPPYLALCAYAVAVAVAVPQINLTISKHLETIVGRVIISKAVLWGVLCLVFGVVFALFKQKYAFLGDGYLMPAKIVEGTYTPYSKNLMFLVMHVHKWGQWDDTGIFAFQVFSIFFGVPYIVLSCVWSDLIGWRRYDKMFCFLLMVLIGSVQYFFGYVEVYAPLPSVVLAFILFGVLALRQGKFPIWSTTVFVVGVALHLLLLFLTPALLFLWWWFLSRKYPIFRGRRVVATGVIVAGVLAGVFAHQKSDILLPLFPSEASPYGTMTLWHVWEYLNAQILSAPLAFPLLLMCVFFGLRFGRETAFLCLCAGGAFLCLYIIDEVHGSVDWDVWALSGVSLMALATYCFQHIKNRCVKQYGALFSCICAGLLVVPFIHINHTDRSIDRVIQITKDDPGSYWASHLVDMHLAISFRSAGLDSLSAVYFEQAYEKNPLDRRNAFNMGMVLLGNDKYAESIFYFLSAVSLSPNYERSLDSLLWLALHVPDLVVEGVETHLPKSRHNDFWVRLGIQGIKTGRVQQVHDLLSKDVVVIGQRVRGYLSEGDTTRAANLLKYVLLGEWEK